MLIKAELTALGVSGRQMCKILADEYGVTTAEGNPVCESVYSSAISGKRNDTLSVKIRDKCWDYINKHKRKEK